jgi:hypothetical protein
VRFELEGTTLRLSAPDGQPLLSYAELARQRDAERQRAERLAAQLRALGIEPAP